MDADTRHQLKQNELAEALSKLRDFSDPRFRYALVGLGVVVVIVLGAYAWRYTHQRTLESNWRTLNELAAGLDANDPANVERSQSDMANFIESASDGGLAGYARLQLARSYMDQALRSADKRAAGFQKAAELLTKITGDPGTPPLLEAAASFALATTCESQREYDQARALYTALANDTRFEGSPFRALAKDRLDNFDNLVKGVPLTRGGPPIVATEEPPPAAPDAMTPKATLTPVSRPAGAPTLPPAAAPTLPPAGAPTLPPAAAPTPPPAPPATAPATPPSP